MIGLEDPASLNGTVNSRFSCSDHETGGFASAGARPSPAGPRNRGQSCSEFQADGVVNVSLPGLISVAPDWFVLTTVGETGSGFVPPDAPLAGDACARPGRNGLGCSDGEITGSAAATWEGIAAVWTEVAAGGSVVATIDSAAGTAPGTAAAGDATAGTACVVAPAVLWPNGLAPVVGTGCGPPHPVSNRHQLRCKEGERNMALGFRRGVDGGENSGEHHPSGEQRS